MGEEPALAELVDEESGWLVSGRHFAEMDDIYREFVAHTFEWDRRTIWLGLQQLLEHMKQLFPSGRLLIAGTFVSKQPGPCDAPEIAIVPDEPSAVELWTDAEEHRFLLCSSLHDVIVGSLGADYFEVVHPFGGRLESYFVVPDDVEQMTMWMGGVTLPTGEEILGHRGVLEVEW